MRLYLMRHGKAEAESHSGRDADRALSDRGRAQSRWMGSAMLAADGADKPALILASPLVRADQTALLLRAALGCTMRTEHSLALGVPPERVIELIDDAAGDAEFAQGRGALVLVGHNPQLETLLALLVPGTDYHDAEMCTGEAALLELLAGRVAPGRARLVARLRMPD